MTQFFYVVTSLRTWCFKNKNKTTIRLFLALFGGNIMITKTMLKWKLFYTSKYMYVIFVRQRQFYCGWRVNFLKRRKSGNVCKVEAKILFISLINHNRLQFCYLSWISSERCVGIGEVCVGSRCLDTYMNLAILVRKSKKIHPFRKQNDHRLDVFNTTFKCLNMNV